MHFVNVASGNKNFCPYEDRVVALTKHSLISIIGGLQQKQFGFDTINRAIEQIRNYKSNYIDKHNGNLYIDSGGYSYIVGDIHPNNCLKMIEMYHYYLTHEQNNFDFIFSLDIPISLKYSAFNTKKHIYTYNKMSLEMSKEKLIEFPNLRDKFYFIWHFKIKSQYEIWKQLYNELDLNKYIKNRAIGGMVGLRKITNIKFSPFIGLSFKTFADFIESGDFTSDFRLHLLGIYNKADRLSIAVLEKLLTAYLKIKNINRSCVITYDSISYMREAHKDSRNLSMVYFRDGELIYFENQCEIPNEILDLIYSNKGAITDELSRIQNNEPLQNIAAFTPITINNQIMIDKFFEYIVTKYNIIDILFNSRNYNIFKNKINSIFLYLERKYPYLFTNQFNKLNEESMKYIYAFHKSFVNDMSNQSIEKLIEKLIENVNFPFELT